MSLLIFFLVWLSSTISFANPVRTVDCVRYLVKAGEPPLVALGAIAWSQAEFYPRKPILAYPDNGQIVLYDLRGGQELKRVGLGDHDITQLSLEPTQTLLPTRALAGDKAGNVVFWNLATRLPDKVYPNQHKFPVLHTEMSVSGEIALTVSRDSAFVWGKDRKIVCDLEPGEGMQAFVTGGISKDEKKVVVATRSGELIVFRAKKFAQHTVHSRWKLPGNDFAKTIMFADSNTFFVVTQTEKVMAWHIDAENEDKTKAKLNAWMKSEWKGEQGISIESAVYHPLSEKLYLGNSVGEVLVFNPDSGVIQRSFKVMNAQVPVSRLIFDDAFEFLLAFSRNKSAVMWDLTDKLVHFAVQFPSQRVGTDSIKNKQ